MDDATRAKIDLGRLRFLGSEADRLRKDLDRFLDHCYAFGYAVPTPAFRSALEVRTFLEDFARRLCSKGGPTIPIIEIQRRYRELGRLRLGRKSAKGHRTPRNVEVYVSRSAPPGRGRDRVRRGRRRVERRADRGGTVELVSESAELRVYVPPQDLASSMFYELWSRGGVRRRCDGETEYVAGVDCICNREGKRVCSITSHLVVMLPQLPDVGVWRVRTSSWNAAAEIPTTVDLLQRIHDEGALPLALLGIESRTVVSEDRRNTLRSRSSGIPPRSRRPRPPGSRSSPIVATRRRSRTAGRRSPRIRGSIAIARSGDLRWISRSPRSRERS